MSPGVAPLLTSRRWDARNAGLPDPNPILYFSGLTGGLFLLEERRAYIGLNMMEGVGPVGVRALRERLGDCAAIFTASRDELMTADGVGPQLAGRILDQRSRLDPDAEEERARAFGATIITFEDAAYPEPLRQIHDPPLALYVRGTLLTGDRQSIAVVGTRRATHYGMETARSLSYQLAQSGFAVVSGLARGIDTAAHRGALHGGGRTLAILGGALDCLYPPENEDLAGEIAEQGALISEFPFGHHPNKNTFPMRNRLVSGLARGILVVEAGIKSGAMITAHQGLEQGRSVFAVPGRVDSLGSRGAHQLLKTGASLVESVDDILAEFEFLLPPKGVRESCDRLPTAMLTDDEAHLVDCMAEPETGVDSLIRQSGLPASAVNAMLVRLEMKRVLRMLPGRVVARVR
mgnify:CR=1 FL=1